MDEGGGSTRIRGAAEAVAAQEERAGEGEEESEREAGGGERVRE